MVLLLLYDKHSLDLFMCCFVYIVSGALIICLEIDLEHYKYLLLLLLYSAYTHRYKG